MGSTTDKITGRVKEAVGVLTDNDRLKREGQTDQVVGAGDTLVGGGSAPLALDLPRAKGSRGSRSTRTTNAKGIPG